MPGPDQNDKQQSTTVNTNVVENDLKRHLEATEDELRKQQQVLDLLKKNREELLAYNESQTKLMEERRQELDIYDFSKRQSFKEDIQKELPADLAKYKKLKEEEKNQYKEHLNTVISADKKEHDNDRYKFDYNRLKVSSIEEFNDLETEVDNIREKIKQDEKALSPEQLEWYREATDTVARDKVDVSSYNVYAHNKQEYEKKQRAFEAEYPPEGDKARWDEEFAEYQTLVARRMMLKNTIKKTAMGRDTVESFKDLDKQKKADPDQYNITKAVISMKMVQASSSNKLMKDLGYDDPVKANRALDDYFEIEDKINKYQIRMQTYGDKTQKKWLNDHLNASVDKYFDKKGELHSGYEEFRTLSGNYSPEKDAIERRSRIMEERNNARFDYYKSAQSLRILQRDAVNVSIEKENNDIKEHNRLENEKKKVYSQWNSQKKCDEQFLKTVESKADEAASTRRKMLVGSVVTGFAAQIMESISDMATKAGTIAAEGIVKGETEQIRKELKDLQAQRDKQIKASVSGLSNSMADKNEAKELSKEDDGKKKDQALFKIVDSNKHSQQGLKAENRALSLQEQIEKKQEELAEQEKIEAKKLQEIEKKISGKQFADSEKKRQENRILNSGNDITDLASSLLEAQKNLDVVNVDKQNDNVSITDDVLNDLMHAKTDLRREQLSKEDADLLKKDAQLREQLKTMQGYSDKLKSLLTPDNIGKVDTVVSICETLYSAYSTASKFINGDAGDDKKEDKKEDQKEDNKEDEKTDEKENEEKDNYELNIIASIQDLKEKAQSISDSMNGKGEKQDNGTIVENITDLTLEAGQIVNIVSKKIQDITRNMEVSLEEARAREEVEKGFLESAKKNTEKSPVESAREELTQQQDLHKRVVEQDLKANNIAIQQQEQVVEGMKGSRDKLLKDLQIYEQRQEEERQRQVEEAFRKAEEAKKNKVEVPDTPEVIRAREEYEAALNKENDIRKKENEAKEKRIVTAGAHEQLGKKLKAQRSQLENFAEDYNKQLNDAKKLQDQPEKNQKEKQKDLLALKDKEISEAKSAIRKTAVKSFFVNIANTAADYSKGFVDQLSIGFAEAVVKGKVKQMEDELSEKEDLYRLKGETALAKDRSKLQHVKKAQDIANSGKDLQTLGSMITDQDIVNKDLKTLESTLKAPSDEKKNFDYRQELKGAALAEQDSKKLQKERGEIGEEIKQMREDLAVAKVKEEKQLNKLNEELKNAYGIDPEASRKINIDTAANRAQAMVALQQVQDKMKETGDPIEIFTSPAFSETDSAQREVIKQEVINLKLDKEVEAKGQKLENISNKLKGLFTPKNMGRVDTVISAAETLYSLYGSVKGFISGDGGGDDKEADEEEKNLAGKIKDIKEKASSIRKGMMGEGEENEDEPKIVENVLSITQSMREITDVVYEKISSVAKEYEIELDTQREIKIKAEREKKELDKMFKENPDLKLTDAVGKYSVDPQKIVQHQTESMNTTSTAFDNTGVELQEAIRDHDALEKELKQAESDTREKKAALDKELFVAEMKYKGKAVREARDLQKEKRKADSELDYADAMDMLFPKTKDEIDAENREKARQEEQARREREERAQRAERERNERVQNDAKMSSLGDILDNLKDTKNAYWGHENSDQFNAVISQMQNFIDKKDDNITFKPEQTEALKKACTDYLDHTGMKSAWHEKGNIRKENVLAALNLIDPAKAKEYEQKANTVRGERKKISLDTLMEREGVRRSPDRKRRAEAERAAAQRHNIAGEKKNDIRHK